MTDPFPGRAADAASPFCGWRTLCSTVKGVRKKYSQDYCRAGYAARRRAVVLSVADGHGSAAHFRSDLGSRWAVEEFTACAEVFAAEAADRGGNPANWTGLLNSARGLPRQVVHRWRERVLLHECNAPAHGGLGARSADEADLPVYGSTLLGAVVTDHLLLCWQLGDGDVVLVSGAEPPQLPLSEGEEIGDETESLCEPESWRRMRMHWQPLLGRETLPAVLLCTDGLSKSFTDQAGFTDFTQGLHDRVAEQGLAAVEGQLGEWLHRAAEFSGDDTSLVAAFPSTDGASAATAAAD